MTKRIFTVVFLTAIVGGATAQDFKKEFDSFRESALTEYNEFRKQCMQEYIDFLRKPWKKKEAKKPVEVPKEKPVPPVVVKDDSVNLDLSHGGGKAISIGGGVIRLKKEIYKQPLPVSPVKEDLSSQNPDYSFDVFGTECEVRIGDDCKFRLSSVSSNDVADALEKMMKPQFDNLLHDCLQIREERKLSDWAYFEMLGHLADAFYGKGSNEATLALAFLYMQSGYKMRLGQDGTNLYMLVCSKHNIAGRPYFPINGENYYILRGKPVQRMNICEGKFPKESSLSLVIPCQQILDDAPSPERTITSRRYPDFSFKVSVNKNMIDFYNTYPTSTLNNDFMTRWAMYANAPIDQSVAGKLYPAMRAKLQGLTKLESMERLLNWVQTGFVYEYDDKVWGGDRAFFGEETLYYPYCDCEDRSILLSHLVRELLGLDTVLIYYPGHLAMAVAFNEAVDGDYVQLDGRRFTVCDPTYIGARVGRTMPDMNNAAAKLILLEK